MSNSLRPYGAIYNRLVYRAKRKGILVEFSYEMFLLFTETIECQYCGASVVWSRHCGQKRSAAYNLDRKNNEEGYSFENCVVCCVDCNQGKGNRFSYEEWVVMTKALKEYRNECHRSNPCSCEA